MTIEPALMEEVERTNVVMMRGLGQRIGAPPRRNPYAMEVDMGRNCYTYRRFGHMAHHCRNQRRVAEEKRLEYKGSYEHKNNLKEGENLGTLN